MTTGSVAWPGSIRRFLTLLSAAILLAEVVAVGLPVAVPKASAAVPRTAVATTVATTAAAVSLPSGFIDEEVVDGLSNPTVVAFAPDGRVFVAEKRGTVQTWPTLAAFNAGSAPVQTIDLRTDVMNLWDRGLLGMAVDPNWPSSPYLDLLYTYDALPGGSAPAWGTPNTDGDSCPSPAPGGTVDGCVVTGRLDRVQVDPTTGVAVARQQLLTGWCQQFPSHSIGSVAFGADGMLYVSAGDGASFNSPDYGNFGGTRPDTTSPVTPRNPCGDPPGGVGGDMTPPTAEGGALRSQSFRRDAAVDAVLDGAVLRLDPATGDAAPDNPAAASADPVRRRMVAYGFRNPFRIAFRPGTNDLYIGDVGFSTWEEVDRLPNPTAAGPTNYGWPCAEGPDTGTYYASAMDLCSGVSNTGPLYTYAHAGPMVIGETDCGAGGASVSGVAFPVTSNYPAPYRTGLFVADYTRNCIVVLPAGGDGTPTGTPIPFEVSAAAPVMLTTDPAGNLVYPDFTDGTVHRIRYHAPTASFTTSPPSGPAPLEVTFDGSGSSGPADITSFDWDFGDGATASGITTIHTYAVGTWTARLTVTDANGKQATSRRTISASNTPPTLAIDLPTCTASCWKVGDVIQLAAHASDAEDGTLPASAYSWHVGLEHCPTPGDCHEHDYFNVSGVAATSIDAPDHDAGSYLRITVTVTDSMGLTATDTIDTYPKETSLTVKSSPGGLPVALDSLSGSGTVSTPVIVGHEATVAAQPTAAIGESTYAFSSWSDGKPIVHEVTVNAASTLIATYRQTGSDASDTCSGAPIRALTGLPTSARFGKPNDVDWIRFQVTKTAWYRIVLGDLPVNGTLALWAGCSRQLATSNQAGTRWEELVTRLAPGTYALRMATVGGVASATSHRWWVKALSGTTPMLMTTTVPVANTLRYVGDIYNTATTARSVTITARLYNATGHVLKTVTTHPLVPLMAGRSRSPYLINVAKPAGFAYVRFTITSTSASTATKLLAVTGAASSPATSTWKVTGTITNGSSSTPRDVAGVVEIYNAMGSVTNATYRAASPASLAKGARATFSVTFTGVAIQPVLTVVRGRAT